MGLDPAKLCSDWPDAPIEPRTPAADETFVAVWTAPNAAGANLLTEQLCARGVPAVRKTREEPMRVGPYTPGGKTMTVVVPSSDLERAEAILARFAR